MKHGQSNSSVERSLDVVEVHHHDVHFFDVCDVILQSMDPTSTTTVNPSSLNTICN